jgi:two-component system capsular synthesis sensor histidine kinase RcsC
MKTFPQIAIMAPAYDAPPDLLAGSRQCPPTARPAPPKRSLHLLCIDDDESILQIMRDLLAYFGHRAEVAPSGKCGIEMFCIAGQKGEPYDVVITDMNMPEVNGYAVAQTIKAESPHTPVILMTGASNTTRDSGALSASVDVVVHKPPHLQELNALLLRMAGPA